MRATSIIAALSAVVTASAMTTFKLMEAEEQKSTYLWEVTNWNAGCARSDFNVTAEANSTTYPKRPAFSAYCHGQGEGAPYELCDLLSEPETDLRLEAKLLPANRTINETTTANIQVSLMHTDLDTPTTWWNYTSKGQATYNQFVAPPMDFTITPSEIFGVA
ncbi:hypothetical protein MGN70_007807 [Eutypa lata]|nr:hypothetical protein MGN70_007807 [Eutypa lata]